MINLHFLYKTANFIFVNIALTKNDDDDDDDDKKNHNSPPQNSTLTYIRLN